MDTNKIEYGTKLKFINF